MLLVMEMGEKAVKCTLALNVKLPSSMMQLCSTILSQFTTGKTYHFLYSSCAFYVIKILDFVGL